MTEYDIGEAFKAIEDELIASMMRNMERHKREESVYDFNWSAWQVEQLKALERYRVNNQDKFTTDFVEINRSIEELVKEARRAGGMQEEVKILKAIQKSYKVQGKNNSTKQNKQSMTADFFKANDRKINALIRSTVKDLEKAETAMLRMAHDQYRKIIFSAQVFANSGAATYKQAVDMATKDFLRAGINCIEYRNGARHTIQDYAKMAIRTANKRAALTGAGEKRNEWGIHTVIVNNRASPCEKCLPFVGVVFIDDVWSGGSRKDGAYPMLSTAISAGLFHPNCKDGTSTYYPGITPIPSKYTKDDLEKVMADAQKESRRKYAAAQAAKFGRMAKYSLDDINKETYMKKEKSWNKEVDNLENFDILNTNSTKEEIAVHFVGNIERDIYQCITEDIKTDEVVITDKQTQHIIERHPDAYNSIIAYMSQVLAEPEYIVKDKHPNTGLVIKKINTKNESLQVVLRIATSDDPKGYKNSIISCWRISEKRLQSYLRNKPILYKKE